jgi:hypothetical protein
MKGGCVEVSKVIEFVRIQSGAQSGEIGAATVADAAQSNVGAIDAVLFGDTKGQEGEVGCGSECGECRCWIDTRVEDGGKAGIR